MSRKLYDKSKPEKNALPYADLQTVENCSLKYSRNQQKQVYFSGAGEDDELVKHMSNLPGYLERGKNIHEKVLNVGVLDWSRLEQWQHRHKQPQKGNRASTSTSNSNTSSSVPAEGFSGHSSTGRSRSASRQRLSRPSLQSYFKSSTLQDHSLGDKTSGENVGSRHNLRGSLGNINAQSKLVGADDYLSPNLHVGSLKACGQKDMRPNISTGSEILPSDEKCEGALCAKIEKGARDSKLEKRMETLQEPNLKTVEQGVIGKSQGEERKQAGATISSADGPSQGRGRKVKSEKSRSSSPFDRFGISMGYRNKGSNCNESLHVPHKSSMAAVRSSSETARVSASSCVSGRNNSINARRSRTSPLRRLLDPILKPKEANYRHSLELSQKDPGLMNNANVAYPHLQLGKDLDRDRRVSCSSINTCDSYNEKKHVSSTSRALLRIAVKNGQPLFTFAVDNDNNVLVAKVKTLSASGKDDCCCIYTFFSFKEVKKKNGNWMNQAGKSKGPNYIHQVVAQMKVSNSHLCDLTGQNCVDFSTVKQFVLFSVELKQNGEASDYQPNHELAAIVLKIPKTVSFINNLHQGSCHNDSQLVHATVVLPSGVHSLPSRGGPSSLIERWKSGGSCDCGGWDLGCKLKILENENEACKSSKPSKAYFAEQFELFLQVNGQDHVPAFSLTPLNHGIYSVSFDSSLSLLQAFSICIALVDSKMPYELSGSRNYVEGKTPRETLSMQNDGIKVLRKLEDIPASYISYPPLSPVGRV
ncbi:uncharacterized protein LOC114732561 [Neltuma alba]|uniref:uncharacterized protein LOC114732561 n=1 Tax=Neltuma alba TaxID=207710 RepID=UPI0010A375DD|nr:uncharacterized protein LOC114732561 [Prosopis alba]